MDFPSPLIRGTLIKRYKRFLSDIELADGTTVTAHCANSGSMMGLKEPGYGVWLSPANNPKRKLQYSWELVDTGTSLVGINTSLPNRIVTEAIRDGHVPELTGYETIRNEVKYGQNSRIDILLQDSANDRPDAYVEVKNVTLKRRDGAAEFPDAVTARGTKHLKELSDMVAAGHRAVMFYLVQREDCQSFEIARDIDPAYGEAFDTARKSGVEVYVYDCQITPEYIRMRGPVPLVE
ncbi:DNA/RNA nuclease SfsA [Sneathiella chinensis]|uniref:Sugar fermentation stimulation protein homolog n=1 Tax=Sneathiella chinensis TaxID=349750 RepID=A0ABQ5U677_9PROT|nr:DNA/RNA nuclease SfsA [Sneathiella chinensis]GLQ07291.1 sugar fermentation stimulation protein [Sneathiella chinensis]